MRTKLEANGSMKLAVVNGTVTVAKNLDLQMFVGHIFELEGEYDQIVNVKAVETGATMTTGSGATAVYVAATGVITYTPAE